MKYLLLTGSTGLVGRYLLRNLLRSGLRVAVLVRPGKVETAAQRVESIMSHWEQEAKISLPRPVVLAADLCSPDLGLGDAERAWITRHVSAMLHCAASMTFREDRRGEPFRTNVQGTENVLELCRRTGIKQFHHVSTAYICGLREGRILESQIDEGQTLGNVYEQSKLTAEKLIRQASFLEQTTFYRPASVVGDSATGYVTNYHGFYLPLQLAFSISGQVPISQMSERFFAKLGLRGDEGKNLVPVDWLTEAITYLVTRPEHHGRTYHLASSHPVQVQDIQRVIPQAIEAHSQRPPAPLLGEQELQYYESLFHDYMLIYRSHWRDDPVFDLTNTERALPHLPCPSIDYEMLQRIARFPVANKFQVRRHDPVAVPFDLNKHLEPLLRASGIEQETANRAAVGLQVNGCGGGQWSLALQNGRLAAAEWGLPAEDASRIYLSAETFGSLARRELTVAQSVRMGRVVLETRPSSVDRLAPVLEQVVGV